MMGRAWARGSGRARSRSAPCGRRRRMQDAAIPMLTTSLVTAAVTPSPASRRPASVARRTDGWSTLPTHTLGAIVL